MDPLYYHLHHTLHMDDLRFWEALAGEHSGPILELGCGTGRLLNPLARSGKDMVGIDIDPAMLAFLKANLSPRFAARVTLVEADMRDFSLGQRFSLVILPCNTFSSFPSPERRKILQAVARHLLPDGRFVVSMPNPAMLLELPEVGEPELEDVFEYPPSGEEVQVTSRWQRSFIPPGTPVMTFAWEYQRGGSAATVTATHFLDSLNVYRSDFEAAGLEIGVEFGEFDFEFFDEQESTYWIPAAALRRA